MIETLVAHDADAIEVGRHRRREVVMIAADRYDALLEQNAALTDLGWAAFAAERVENPTSDPVDWDEAQRRRRRR